MKIKSDDGSFQLIMKKEEILPFETIFIDDNKNNIEVANKNGIKGILFHDAKQLKSELQKMHII